MHAVNLNRIDLNLLVVFAAIARTRSVTAAAGALALSQPATSHALARLRVLFADPLFVRVPGGLALTRRAEDCLPAVEAALGAISGLLHVVPFDPSTTRRTFRVAASDYAMQTVLPGFTTAVRRAAPRSRLDVQAISPDLHDGLAAGAIDLAFVGNKPTRAGLLSNVLFREHFVGLVCAGHPLAAKARRGRVSLDDYLAHPHITVSFQHGAPSPIDVRLASLGRRRRVAMMTPSFAANTACLADSDLVLSLPSRLVTGAGEGAVVAFRLPLPRLTYPYFAVWHRRGTSDPALAWLRSCAMVTDASTRPPASPVTRTVTP